MAFHFSRCAIPEVFAVLPDVHGDARGFFAELYKVTDFKAHGLFLEVKQVDHSKSSKNVLRGLHYQLKPKAQGKLVCVVKGAMYDVAVDIRKGSPTFGKYVSAVLNAEKKNMLFIPEGFAHGFCVLTDTVEVLYHCTDVYSPKDARTIAWNDPTINIAWPITNPILSEKDMAAVNLEKAETNFLYEY